MRQIKIGETTETVIERSDYPPEKIRQILGNETIAVLGYGVQGRGQSLNMKDNGVNVIIGIRPNGKADPNHNRPREANERQPAPTESLDLAAG